MPHVIQPTTDPGTKDSLPTNANPPKPPVKTGFHTLDNTTFSNVQKRLPRSPSTSRKRDGVYIRMPGLQGRPIRPRKFIYVADADIVTLRTVTIKSSGAAGSTAATSFIFTGDVGEDFIADGVVVGDVLILTAAGGSNGRYIVTAVLSATTLQLDQRTPATDASVTYQVISPNNFVDVVNRLIEQGSLEVRTSAGTALFPIVAL